LTGTTTHCPPGRARFLRQNGLPFVQAKKRRPRGDRFLGGKEVKAGPDIRDKLVPAVGAVVGEKALNHATSESPRAAWRRRQSRAKSDKPRARETRGLGDAGTA
jgi:hypothetical protein